MDMGQVTRGGLWARTHSTQVLPTATEDLENSETSLEKPEDLAGRTLHLPMATAVIWLPLSPCYTLFSAFLLHRHPDPYLLPMLEMDLFNTQLSPLFPIYISIPVFIFSTFITSIFKVPLLFLL